MPSLLSPQALVLLQEDTDYLNAGIPIWGSRVVQWEGMTILIYHTKDVGYVVSNISDLPQSTIDQLMKQSDVHGMWYYLPQSIQDVIAEDAEAAVEAAKAVGGTAADILAFTSKTIGDTIANLIQPLVPLLIIGVAIGVIYLAKKG